MIHANELNEYLQKESIKLIDRLKTTNLNNFTKQWINEAIMSVFVVFNDFKQSLDNSELRVRFSLNLFKTFTNKSLNIYLKLNIIYFLIVCKFDKNFIRVFNLFKIDYGIFKNDIFKFFNFNKNLKIIYSEEVLAYKNDMQRACFHDFYKNLFFLAYGKKAIIKGVKSS